MPDREHGYISGRDGEGALACQEALHDLLANARAPDEAWKLWSRTVRVAAEQHFSAKLALDVARGPGSGQGTSSEVSLSATLLPQLRTGRDSDVTDKTRQMGLESITSTSAQPLRTQMAPSPPSERPGRVAMQAKAFAEDRSRLLTLRRYQRSAGDDDMQTLGAVARNATNAVIMTCRRSDLSMDGAIPAAAMPTRFI